MSLTQKRPLRLHFRPIMMDNWQCFNCSIIHVVLYCFDHDALWENGLLGEGVANETLSTLMVYCYRGICTKRKLKLIKHTCMYT